MSMHYSYYPHDSFLKTLLAASLITLTYNSWVGICQEEGTLQELKECSDSQKHSWIPHTRKLSKRGPVLVIYIILNGKLVTFIEIKIKLTI